MDMFDEKNLLDFNTYEDYLDSLVTNDDLCYLRSSILGRQIASLGYKWAFLTNLSSFFI